MTPTPYRKGRLLFILTLWLVLGVAMLSAVAPLGPPSSRYTGSAFNPATTGVVLKARPMPEPAIAQAAEPGGDRPLPPVAPAMIWFLPMAPWLPGMFLLLSASRFFRFRSDAHRPFQLLSLRRARAPPAFF